MTLIDIGINLTGRQFNRDRDQVVKDAVASGVTKMVVTGTNETASRDAALLTGVHPGVLWATAGVHPHDAKTCTPDTPRFLRHLTQLPGVVAVGECGLDFNRDNSPRPVQETWFEAQLELAAEVQLPVFLHERDAHERFVEILRPWRDKLVGAVVHCFTGEDEALKTYLDLDCHIGITGWICDERRGKHLRGLVRNIPSNRLMIETDAPWLKPRDLKTKDRRNVPANLPHIAHHVADCVGKTVEQVSRETTETAEAFFGI